MCIQYIPNLQEYRKLTIINMLTFRTFSISDIVVMIFYNINNVISM